ncbi:P-loop NTPase fold protein [Citrobacter portucalensis]|uniref:P-loop NTPase fold protein n=1 Tax=Citrobacter portucalensis TaxID=1639133 RepID=UPI001A26D93D|nr:P-loop NTPase fold protein [Citrobacter portucalensis]
MKNKHIIESINYYSNLDKPGYAILLTGEWGAGKTHLIKNHFKPYEYTYVSLFGLCSLDDIYASVYNAMHPKKGRLKSITNNFKDVEAGFSGFTMGLGGMANGLANSIMRESVDSNKIIVFDDLERSSINPAQILGAINKYVEHHDCKVIAIAHDEKFGSKLTETKEKIIGLTLKVVPDIISSFEAFTVGFRFIELKNKFKDTFLNIFTASQCKSLRVLKHTIEDAVRLLDGLDDDVKSNLEATNSALSIFIALDIEVRWGKIKEDDLRNRSEQIRAYTISSIRIDTKAPEIEDKPPTIYNISRKYKPVSIESNIISDDDIVNTLLNGYFNFKSINQSIYRTKYFVEKKDTPTWSVLYNLDTLDDDVLKATIEKFNTEFDSRQHTAIGEILHIFNFRLLMASTNEIPQTLDKVELECKKYIDDLVESDRLPTLKEDPFFTSPFPDSYGSLGFWVLDSYKEISKELRKYMFLQQENMLRKNYSNISQELINYISNDPYTFCGMISYEYNKKGLYLENDVLSEIPPSVFIDAWLKAPRENWNNIKDALEYRYSNGRLHNVLVGEKLWLRKIIKELKNKIKASNGFNRYRLERILPTTLISELEDEG